MAKNNKLAAIIAGCRHMDEASQIELYRHFYSYGMSICLRYSRSRESALEMLNDGFFKVFQKINQYDSEFPFKPWLRKVMINASIDHYRKYQKNVKQENWLPEEGTPAYNEALDNLQYDDLIKIIHLLPPAYQMTFNLYVIEGLTHKEIAEQLGTTVGTSKSNLSKARIKIKELLKSSHDIHMKT